MTESVAHSLLITALGMPILFLALALFYGLIALLEASTRARQGPQAAAAGSQRVSPAATEDTQDMTHDLRAQAVAVAVALARAEISESPLPSLGLGNARLTSPWWSYHHSRRLTVNSRARRAP